MPPAPVDPAPDPAPRTRPTTRPAPPMVPAVAVVDSRNVHGWAGRVLGHVSTPTVAGVVHTLAPYGFDVQRVAVSVALPDRRGGDERYQRRAEANRRYAAEVRAHERGHVLVGKLGTTGEKLVDVQCAVEICRQVDAIAGGRSEYQSVLVLSHDTDLLPAVDYAAERGVPAYLVTADGRDRQRPWILLGEHGLVTLVGQTPKALAAGGYAHTPGRRGDALRRAVADFARVPRQCDWHVESAEDDKHHLDGKRMVRARAPDPACVPAVAPPGTARRGEVLRSWWSAGVHLDARDSFPFVEIARDQPGRPRLALYELRVYTRISAARALVEPATHHGEPLHLDIPPGGPLDGATVLVAEVREPGKAPVFRYVANLSPACSVPAVRDVVPVLVRTVAARGVRATLTRTEAGHEIEVHHAPGHGPEPGRRHAVWVTAVDGTRGLLLSAALPDVAD